MAQYLQRVALRGIDFTAYHGYYPEEQLTGSRFIVDVEMSFEPSGDPDDLDNTVNYEFINTVVREEMQRTAKLLETVIRRMLDRLILEYPATREAIVGIRKMHPPMPGQIDHSHVTLTYTA